MLVTSVGDRPYLLPLTRRGDLMGMASHAFYSAEMVRALPDDGNRYETVHGELLVTPTPRARHQVVLGRLFFNLCQYLEANPLGTVLTSPADISWGPDVLVQPDLFVVPTEEVQTLEWSQMKSLLLAVEILSPGTARPDRFTKRRLYQNVGVPLYWILDTGSHSVETWTPDATFPSIERDRIVWKPSNHPAFELRLSELFEGL